MQNKGLYIWNFVNRFGTQVIWLVTSMVLARYLTPEDFGIIGILSVLYIVANTITESGLGGALVIQKTIDKDDCATICIFSIVVSTLLYGIIFISSNAIENFYNINGLSIIIKLLSLVFVINAYSIVPIAILSHQLKFKTICIITIISVTFSAIVSIAMGINGYGVYALVSYQILQSLIRALGSLFITKYKFAGCFKWERFKALFSFGFFTTLSSVINTLYENLLAILFGKCLSVGQAGLLSQAKKIEEASTQAIMSSIINTSFPVLAKLSNQKKQFENEALRILKNVPIIVFPILCIVAIYSKEVVTILYGSKWIEASSYLSVLIIAGMFMVLDAMFGNFIKSLGFVKELFKITLIKRILGCLAILIFCIISINNILWGYVVSSMIGTLMTLFIYCSLINTNFISIVSEFKNALIYISLFAVLIITGYIMIENLWVKLSFGFFITCGYYLFILPKVGFNILSILNKYRN